MSVLARITERIRKPFIALLQQGITPEKLALSVALGFTLGIIPILGSTTLLCALAGLLFGLNHPAIQSVNHIAYPAQIGLLIPFYRMGEWLFKVPHLVITTEGVKHLIQSGVMNAIHVLWDTTWRAVTVWGLIAPVLIGTIYLVTRPFFARLILKYPRNNTQEDL